jgi:signal transduction histidine kinase
VTRTLAWLGLPVGTCLIALDVAGRVRNAGRFRAETADTEFLIFVVLAGVAIVLACALCALRPDSRVGPLLLIWPLASLVDDLSSAYPDSQLAVTLAPLADAFTAPVLAHLTLSYPTGRLGSTGARVFVALVYVVSLVRALPYILFFDYESCWWCPQMVNAFGFRGDPLWFSFVDWNRKLGYVLLGLTLWFVVLVARKLLRSPRGAWRTMAPLIVAVLIGAATLGTRQIALVLAKYDWLPTLDKVELVTSVAVLLALVVGLLATRRRGGTVGELAVELERVEPGGVRDALARALGDPSLELALWLPDRRAWVDEEGHPVELPDGPGRSVTFVGEGERRVAAIVHDPALADQRAMIAAAGSVARLALENERLQAELRAQLTELRASRARIVHATDAERRRLERDLHDGVQQRLLGLALVLQLLNPRIDEGSEAAELLGDAERELQAAVRDLREFARGIHPAILGDQGLAAAARTLAVRSPIPVDVRADDERLPAAVETAAYFLIAEGLANVAKYSKASRAWVTVERRNGKAIVEVGDDGVGGADARCGSGLRGLADRVAALDGSLLLDSPSGRGTRVVAEIPCA